VPVLPEPMTHPRSLRLCSGQAGQVREDGAPGRALNGTTEDGGIAARPLLINCVKLTL